MTRVPLGARVEAGTSPQGKALGVVYAQGILVRLVLKAVRLGSKSMQYELSVMKHSFIVVFS